MSKIEKLREAFKNEPTPENELALLRAENEILQSEKKPENQGNPSGQTDGVNLAELATQISTATARAIKQASLPTQRPTLANLDKLVMCHECVVDKSESTNELLIVEIKRRNVPIEKDKLEQLNSPMLTQPRAIAFIPVTDSQFKKQKLC